MNTLKHLKPEFLKSVAVALEKGLKADIFYDAADHEDWERLTQIEDFEEAVTCAIRAIEYMTSNQELQETINQIETLTKKDN